ncbi:hypothetical protein AB0F40_13805, partial [Promicromonospora sp. NPDC023987]
MYAGRSDGGSDDGMAGAFLADELPPGTGPDERVRGMPDRAAPGDLPSELPPDLAGGPPPDFEPSAGPDWPPSVVPVALWPVEILQQALTGAPGAQLARIVAEATDRATEMDPDLLADLPDDALGDLVTACGRLQSWAAGVQARVVAERSARETHA